MKQRDAKIHIDLAIHGRNLGLTSILFEIYPSLVEAYDKHPVNCFEKNHDYGKQMHYLPLLESKNWYVGSLVGK